MAENIIKIPKPPGTPESDRVLQTMEAQSQPKPRRGILHKIGDVFKLVGEETLVVDLAEKKSTDQG